MSRRGASRNGPSASPARARRADGLPLELTSFVGREAEISEVGGLMEDHRLLTLVGPGGCGKTRLSRAVLPHVVGGFADGIRWVGLASLSEPDLVLRTVTGAVGVREVPGLSLLGLLVGQLEHKEMLLALDNCEHVIGACATLADALLEGCPDLKIIATSREPLGVPGEVSWLVPPLSLPERGASGLEALARNEAVRLFAERARSVSSGFALAGENIQDVARVCQRLDGMPLAIELAAARVGVLSPRQVLRRLDDRFRLLTGGGRARVPHHRTLHSTVDWSHDLLSPEEQAFFRRLSVFAGGFTLEAAEDVCSGGIVERGAALDLLSGLARKSLLVVVPGKAGGDNRYGMLETIQAYARDKLNASSEESEDLRRRQAEYFLGLAEEAESALEGPDQASWLERLEAEHDNIRAALGFFGGRGEAERGLRLAAALRRFWWFRGHHVEGRTQLEGFLGLPGRPVRDEPRARALHALGLQRHVDYTPEEWATSRSRLEESLRLYRRLGDGPRSAAVLQNLARVEADLGQWRAAFSNLEESLRIGRRLGNDSTIAHSHFYLGIIHLLHGDFPAARSHFEEGLRLFQELDDAFWIGGCLVHLGYLDCEEGDLAAARARLLQVDESLPLASFPWGATYALDGFARLASAEGRAAVALRLGGATTALRRTYGVAVGPVGQGQFRRSLEPAWRALGEREGRAAYEKGQAMTLEEALDLARATLASEPRANKLLSSRETEILSLVAEGLTDARIAESLYLSPRTVGGHLRGAYRKLGVKSRTAAIKRADELGLI